MPTTRAQAPAAPAVVLPTIDAGADQQQANLAQVTLTAVGSDYDSLAWALEKVASDGTVTDETGLLSAPTALVTTFTPDSYGSTWTGTCTATNGDGSTVSRVVVVVQSLDLPVITVGAPIIWQTAPGATAMGVSITGAVSYDWTAEKVTEDGTISTPVAASIFDDPTAENPVLTTSALGDVFAARVVATAADGSTATATVSVAVLAPDKVTFAPLNLASPTATRGFGAGVGNAIDSDLTTLGSSNSTLTTGTVASAPNGTSGVLLYNLGSSFNWAAYAGVIIKLVATMPASASRRALGIGLQNDETPATGEGVVAWYTVTGGGVTGTTSANTGSASAGGSAASTHDSTHMLARFLFGSAAPKAVSSQIRNGSNTVRAEHQYADGCSGYASANLLMGLHVEKASANAEAFTGVRVLVGRIPAAT